MLPVFVISLKTSEQRRLRMKQMLDALALPFEISDAVDGRKLRPEEQARYYDAHANKALFKRPLSHAEIGCYLSHRQLWEQIKTLGSAAVILEDDGLVDPALPEILKALEAYDLSDALIKIDGVRSKPAKYVSVGQLGTTHRILREPHIAPRTTGYIIGPGAATRLTTYQPRFFRPVDMDLKHYWEHQVPIYTIAPPLVSEVRDPNDLSTIAASRDNAKSTNPIARGWKNFMYQLNYRWSYITSSSLNSRPLPKQP